MREYTQNSIEALLNKIKEFFNRQAFVFYKDNSNSKNSKTIIRTDSYGTEAPSTLTNPQEGQIYFHIQE